MKYFELYSFQENEIVFPLSKQTIERYSKELAKYNNISEKEYSSHSFRRGGAFTASARGVRLQHSKYGRRKSTYYLNYTSVERRAAGNNVISALIQ